MSANVTNFNPLSKQNWRTSLKQPDIETTGKVIDGWKEFYYPNISFERLSNTPVLQSSTKNLMVNQAAFQKVFRARFDEGRSNINASNYSINELKQQFLTDNDKS